MNCGCSMNIEYRIDWVHLQAAMLHFGTLYCIAGQAISNFGQGAWKVHPVQEQNDDSMKMTFE